MVKKTRVTTLAAIVCALVVWSYVTQAETQSKPKPASPDVWKTTTTMRSSLYITKSQRSISFPCPPTVVSDRSLFSNCQDPLASNRMILNGPRKEWENYLICFEGEVHCVAVGQIWEDRTQ